MAALGNVNVRNLFDSTAGSGFGDKDDYLGTRIYAGVHLPAVNWLANTQAPVMKPNGTVEETLRAGSNMGLSFNYFLTWRHSVRP
jgi:ABC-type phosphate/phosphonate transport system substrate-binding protein